LFEVEDATFTEPGMVGLWTKADNVTAFNAFAFGRSHKSPHEGYGTTAAMFYVYRIRSLRDFGAGLTTLLLAMV
jgi:hypothetical protein